MMLPNMPFRKADAHPLRLNTRCKDLTLVPSTQYIASASRSLDHRKALGFQVHVGVAGNATVEIEMLEITRGSWAKTQCCRLIWQESHVYLVSSLAKPLSNGATPWQRFTAVYPSLASSSPLFCRQCPHSRYESLTLDGIRCWSLKWAGNHRFPFCTISPGENPHLTHHVCLLNHQFSASLLLTILYYIPSKTMQYPQFFWRFIGLFYRPGIGRRLRPARVRTIFQGLAVGVHQSKVGGKHGQNMGISIVLGLPQ